jgi:hypothetical protein
MTHTIMGKISTAILVRQRELRLIVVAHVAIAAALLCGLIPSAASAGVVFTTVSGSDSDGPLFGTVLFTAVNGGLEVTVTNTLPSSDSMAKGEAISAFSFTVSGLGDPTGFSKLSGSTVDSATFTAGQPFPGSSTVTPFSDTPGMSTPDAIDHWGFAPSGASVTLATAGSGVSGATKSPIYMILPSSGETGSGSSLADGHFDPYILGPGQFFITVPGITSSTNLLVSKFSNVTVGFGTTPDKTLSTTGMLSIPEPTSIVLAAFGGLALLACRKSTRRT